MSKSNDMLGIAVRKLVTQPNYLLGLVCDLLEKLADPQWVDATKKFLRKENPWLADPLPEFKVWRTVRLGTGLRTADDFRAALTAANCRFNDAILSHIEDRTVEISEDGRDVQLVILRDEEEDLGLDLFNDTELSYDDLCARAQSLGLALCPPEVGLQLRLQYEDQPKGEWLQIAMQPIRNELGFDPKVFCVTRSWSQDAPELFLGNGQHHDIHKEEYHKGLWVFLLQE